jgi:translin
MERPTSKLETIAQRIHDNFVAKDEAREKALRCCREVIRNSAMAIRCAHRHEFEQGKSCLEEAHKLVVEARDAVSKYNDLRHAGFLHDAQKEYAEGRFTLALVRGKQIPDLEELDVTDAAYLNGLGEAVGEMRRYLLDAVRKGDLSRYEEFLGNMDDIYSVLVTMDFPDALTYNLRRNTDVVRGITEKTRSDMTLTVRQRELEQKIQAYMERDQGLKG